MNDMMKTILARRSIRDYQSVQIKDEELTMMLEAGRFAPSGANSQSWHFTVIQNQEVLKNINDACKTFFLRSGNKMFEERAKAENFCVFYNAPTLIIVSGDEKAVTPQADCAISLGYMFLAATSIGIGSCWINAVGSIPELAAGSSLRKAIAIPEGNKIFGAGAFGYMGSTQPTAAPRKEGTANFVK